MILNVSFEKTINVEIQVPDNTPVDDVDALISAIQASEEAGYLDEWLGDQPVIGYQIDDEEGFPLYKDLAFNL